MYFLQCWSWSRYTRADQCEYWRLRHQQWCGSC